MKQALTPVAEPLSPEVAAILENYPKREGYILQLFRVFANSIRFLQKGTVNLLDRDSPISMRQREIVILRVCANNRCEYEWGVHVAGFSRHVKLSAEQVEATCRTGVDAGDWPAEELLLIRVVDDLCESGSISECRLADFQQTWNLEQQLEILALCGNYHTISFVANTARLPLEEFAPEFPAIQT